MEDYKNIFETISLCEFIQRSNGNSDFAIKILNSFNFIKKYSNCHCCRSQMHFVDGGKRDEFYYKCSKCGKKLNWNHFTIFSEFRFSPFQFICLLFHFWSKHSISEVTHETNLSNKTVLKFNQKIRRICGFIEMECFEKIGKNRIVEIDETLVHKRKNGVGRIQDQQWLWGVCERKMEGAPQHFKVEFVANRTEETLMYFIEKNIDKSAIVYSDMWSSYQGIKIAGYKHDCVNHSLNFVKPEDKNVHTQTIECMWSHIKCHMRKRGRVLEQTKEYALEFQYRFNTKKSIAKLICDMCLINRNELNSYLLTYESCEMEIRSVIEKEKILQQSIYMMKKNEKETENVIELFHEEDLDNFIRNRKESSKLKKERARENRKIRMIDEFDSEDDPAKIENETKTVEITKRKENKTFEKEERKKENKQKEQEMEKEEKEMEKEEKEMEKEEKEMEKEEKEMEKEEKEMEKEEKEMEKEEKEMEKEEKEMEKEEKEMEKEEKEMEKEEKEMEKEEKEMEKEEKEMEKEEKEMEKEEKEMEKEEKEMEKEEKEMEKEEKEMEKEEKEMEKEERDDEDEKTCGTTNLYSRKKFSKIISDSETIIPSSSKNLKRKAVSRLRSKSGRFIKQTDFPCIKVLRMEADRLA
ncbi:putative ISXO2-like transposase domain [Monocercomonoides exilis]|uniref:putative ISXO2-like transposase domain n=1 Tax=Monocercomonoides exilis TaxID=2049356 RepID=UPI003559D9D3|nr:putative ISXO2-like transposase domain [Monocercomonoides exilis]